MIYALVPLLAICIMPAAAQDGQVLVFSQIMVYDSDNRLVTYLEPGQTSHRDDRALHEYFDSQTALGPVGAADIGGVPHEAISRTQHVSFDELHVSSDAHDMVSSTSLFNSIGGQQILLVRFVHDGYFVTAGDRIEAVWTFVRPA